MPYFSYSSPVITVESCLGSVTSGLNYLKEVKSPFLRPGSTLATRLEASLPAIAEPLCKNIGKVDWVWVKGTPYHHAENMVRRVAAWCPGWTFSLHCHSERGCALMKSKEADPFSPKLHRQIQFAGDFGDLKRKPRLLKFFLENFLGTFKILGEREEVAGWCSWPSRLQSCIQGQPESCRTSGAPLDRWWAAGEQGVHFPGNLVNKQVKVYWKLL